MEDQVCLLFDGDCRGRECMVVGFTSTYAIKCVSPLNTTYNYTTYGTSAHHHLRCEFESRPGRGVQHYM